MADVAKRKKKLLCKLALARADVQAALRATELVIDLKPELDSDLYWALNSAVVVSYARPFTENRPLGRLPKRYAAFDGPRFQLLHEQLLELRRTVVAHSDFGTREVWIIPTTPTPGGMARAGTKVSVYGFELDVFPEIRDLCLDVGSRIALDVEQLLLELYRGIALPPDGRQLNVD